eukprot:scaffold27087_cov130-Isochrysis_galbana.AAC.2
MKWPCSTRERRHQRRADYWPRATGASACDEAASWPGTGANSARVEMPYLRRLSVTCGSSCSRRMPRGRCRSCRRRRT